MVLINRSPEPRPVYVSSDAGLPIGLGKHLFTTPLGIQTTLDADAGKLSPDESALLQHGDQLDGA